jgi:glycosyltransferase involved in cell wall biosynthesis
VRVLIDAVPLLIRSAGVKNYLYHWIAALRRAAGIETVATWPKLDRLAPLNHERSVAGLWTTSASLAALALSNYTPLPVADWCARDADVFHACTLRRNPPRRARVTATIHDMTAWLMPELHPAANRQAEHSFARVLQRADAAIAVSQSTKDDAVRILGLPPEKVMVIHSGVPDAFFDVQPEAAAAIRKRYCLERPFVLFVGTIEPRKNIDTLLDAYGALPRSVREEFEMVVAGPIGWAAEGTAARLSQVRYLGYVPEEDLAALTAAAAVFVYPSLYEGFGFPVAQALAAGVPVLTSTVSSLPELAGDAALLVDPRSTAELRDALARLLLAPDLRADLSARGRCRAQHFRWDRCAAQSLRFFQSVCGKS